MGRLLLKRNLAAQTKTLDERTVAVNVNTLEVSKETTTLTNHKKQATTAVVVVLVGLKVLGEVLDALAQNSNLNLRRTGVTWVCCILFNYGSLNLWVKCHSSVLSVRCAFLRIDSTKTQDRLVFNAEGVVVLDQLLEHFPN